MVELQKQCRNSQYPYIMPSSLLLKKEGRQLIQTLSGHHEGYDGLNMRHYPSGSFRSYLDTFRYPSGDFLAVTGRFLLYSSPTFISYKANPFAMGGHHGRDRMVVGFTTTYAISACHH